MNDVSESLKETIKTRLSNPLWGYITLSWLGFNWQNIATLFMGTEPVNFRIYAITSQDYFYLHYLIAPVILGFSLTVFSPYLQLFITKTHILAKKMKDSYVYKEDKELAMLEDEKEKNKYQKEIELAEIKAAAEFAKNIATAKQEKKLIEIEETGKREKLRTEELEKQFSNLREEIQIEEKRLKDTISRKDLLSKQAIIILKLIEKFNPKTIDEIGNFQKKIYESINLHEMRGIRTELALQEKQTEPN